MRQVVSVVFLVGLSGLVGVHVRVRVHVGDGDGD